MANKNYRKGVRKEYKIMKELRAEGYQIVARTAGSHSSVDVFAIRPGEILFVQSKPKNYKSQKLLEDNAWLNGTFQVRFEVR